MQLLCVYIFIFCDGPVSGRGVEGRRKREGIKGREEWRKEEK